MGSAGFQRHAPKLGPRKGSTRNEWIIGYGRYFNIDTPSFFHGYGARDNAQVRSVKWLCALRLHALEFGLRR
eukprot:scaffold66611_cov65-Phaeocystis_antarctica.AAC.7